MNLSKRSALIALTAAMSLAGCGRNEPNPDKNPDNQVGSQKSSRTRAADVDQREAATNEQASPHEDEAQRSPTPPVVFNAPESTEDTRSTEHVRANDEDVKPIVVTPERREDQEPAQARPAQARNERQDQRKPGFVGNAYGTAKGAVLGTGAAIGYYGSELYHAWRPTQETTGRRDALDTIHDQKAKTRAAAPGELATLKEQIAQSAPDRERITSIVGTDTDTKRLLVNVLTERNPEAVAGASERLVGEVFKVADDADAKVQQVQLGLRELAMNDAYDTAASARVSYLQTELDKRVAADDLQSTLKRGSFLVLTTAAAAAFGGVNGVDRTAAAIHKIPFKRTVAAVEEGADKATSVRWWKRLGRKTKKTVEAKTEGAAEAGSSLTARLSNSAKRLSLAARRPFLRKMRPVELTKADIREVLDEVARTDKSVDVEATLKTLDLKRTFEKNLPSFAVRKDHEVTKAVGGKDGLNVMQTDRITGVETPEGQYRLVFLAQRKPNETVQVFYSAPLENQVSDDLAQKMIKSRTPAKSYVVVNEETGVRASDEAAKTVAAAISSTEGAASELAAGAESAAGAVTEGAAKAGDKLAEGAKDISDAAVGTIDRAADTVAEGAQNVGQKASDVAEDAAASVNHAGSVEIEGQGRALPPATETQAKLEDAALDAKQDIKDVADKTKAGIETAGKKVSDAAAATVEKTENLAKRSLNKIRGDQPFDPAKAAVVGSLVGVPAYLFSRSAYYQGRRAGEGYDTLYLEDLIPADRLQKVVLQPNGSRSAAE